MSEAHGMATQHLSIKEAVEGKDEGLWSNYRSLQPEGAETQYVITAGI